MNQIYLTSIPRSSWFIYETVWRIFKIIINKNKRKAKRCTFILCGIKQIIVVCLVMARLIEKLVIIDYFPSINDLIVS